MIDLMKKLTATILITALALIVRADSADNPVWPLPPDVPRVAFIREINFQNLVPKTGFWSKFARFIGGRSETENLSLPFDVLVRGHYLYLTCQNTPSLIEVDLVENNFKLYNSDAKPFMYPIALCDGGDGDIFITDSEGATVYRFHQGRVEPFIINGLIRPTGIAAIRDLDRIYVIDTGDHSLKIFDYKANPVKVIDRNSGENEGLSFPTFATVTDENAVLVNDVLNYRIKKFDEIGNFISAFGSEGDGPGCFARPKGLATDSENHIYVVDNLFDNIQVFDQTGRLLLVIGTQGQDRGQFWSPAGIDIENDTIYVADTFNNRIQVLHYLGGSR